MRKRGVAPKRTANFAGRAGSDGIFRALMVRFKAKWKQCLTDKRHLPLFARTAIPGADVDLHALGVRRGGGLVDARSRWL
jgi:hypothetical protein